MRQANWDIGTAFYHRQRQTAEVVSLGCEILFIAVSGIAISRHALIVSRSAGSPLPVHPPCAITAARGIIPPVPDALPDPPTLDYATPPAPRGSPVVGVLVGMLSFALGAVGLLMLLPGLLTALM